MSSSKTPRRLADQLLELTSGPAPDEMFDPSEEELDAQVESADDESSKVQRGWIHVEESF